MAVSQTSYESAVRETTFPIECTKESKNFRNCSTLNRKIFRTERKNFVRNYLLIKCSNQTEQGYFSYFAKKIL